MRFKPGQPEKRFAHLFDICYIIIILPVLVVMFVWHLAKKKYENNKDNH